MAGLDADRTASAHAFLWFGKCAGLLHVARFFPQGFWCLNACLCPLKSAVASQSTLKFCYCTLKGLIIFAMCVRVEYDGYNLSYLEAIFSLWNLVNANREPGPCEYHAYLNARVPYGQVAMPHLLSQQPGIKTISVSPVQEPHMVVSLFFHNQVLKAGRSWLAAVEIISLWASKCWRATVLYLYA